MQANIKLMKTPFLIFIYGCVIFLALISVVQSKLIYFPSKNVDIFVVDYGWHAGILVKVDDINNSIWEIDSFFEEFEYIEVGWGDEDFYKNSDPSVWMTLKAGLVPTSSVIHLRAVSRHELNRFSKDKIVKLTISKKGFDKLSMFIQNSFAKQNNKFIPLSKGLYPNSLFYLSSKKYHLFNTCNVWTAKALQSAGMEITPFISITTDTLFSQLK